MDDKDGRKQQSSEFHELVAWAKLGEICNQYLKKGKLVYVEGYLKTRSKVMPDNTKKFRTEIVVQDMIILEKRPKDGNEEEDKKMLEAIPMTEEAAETVDSSAAGDVSMEAGDVFEG